MKALRKFSYLLFAFTLAVAAGCQSDSPTEPSGGGGPISPQPPPPVVTYNVTVTASPAELSAGGSTPTNITVNVTRSDNGQPPPNLTPVTLSTTLGEFGSIGSGQQTIQVQLINGQAQAVLYPGANAGTATVRATVDGTNSAGAANVRIGEQDTFFVGFVEPGVGTPEGGQEVTIVGGGFDGPVRVTFNGAVAQVRSVTPNRIRVITPSALAAGVNVGVGQAQPVSVAVTINVNEQNSQTDTLANAFTYQIGPDNQQPAVFAVDPSSGSNDGGFDVVITGRGFSAPVQVFFGEGSEDSFRGIEGNVRSVTPTQIIVVAPAARGFGIDNVNQNVDILIRNRTGLAIVANERFTYGVDVQITAVSQSTGPYTGGTPVAIFGNGFDEPVAVTLGGIAQHVRNVSGNQIQVETTGILVTECPVNGRVRLEGWSVVNIETGDGDTFPGVFDFVVPRPVVTGINPVSGTPGSTATLSGFDFNPSPNNSTPGVQVVFGDPTNGSAAQVTPPNTSGSINIRVPNAPQGFTFNTEPCDGNGDGIAGGTRSIPTPISVSVRNLNGTGCVGTLTNAYTLNPSSTTCTGDTSTPPAPAQCADGADNDGDGRTDFNANPALGDPQCTSPTDNSEST